MTRVVPALAAAILAAAFVSVQPGVRAQQSPLRLPPALVAKAQSEGAVRVIVGVRAPFAPEGQLQSVDEVRGQRQTIADIQTTVINRLEGFGPIGARQFETIPYFAAELNPAAVSYLASLPEVASVEEDIPVPPVLGESVPLINVPTAWSGGYTGAGWNVAVLDTGVRTSHAFLGGNLISEACYSSHNVHLVSGLNDYGFTTSLCPGSVASSIAAAMRPNGGTGSASILSSSRRPCGRKRAWSGRVLCPQIMSS